MVSTLQWKNESGATRIDTLKQLLQVLISIPQEKIQKVVGLNRKKTEEWIMETFPDKVELQIHFTKEYSNQQWHEQIVRDLRRITSLA
jgi:hypothetical protein